MTTKKPHLLIHAALILSTMALTGCSEEYGSGADQEIFVHTSPEGAHCALTNKRGAWEVFKTPEHVNITRGRDALAVQCSDYKGWTGQARIGANGSISGISDAVGSIQVDAIDSVFMKYPDQIMVKLSPPSHDTSGGANFGGISEESLDAIQKRREAETAALAPVPAPAPPPQIKKTPRKVHGKKTKPIKKPESDCLPAGMRPAR